MQSEWEMNPASNHQSQLGPFISTALHVCVSDSDPVCVPHLAPLLVSLLFVCILLRERGEGVYCIVW